MDSEFTTKAATLQGDSENFASGLNVKFCDLTDCVRVSRLFRMSVENTSTTLKIVVFVECGVAGRAGAMRAIAPCWENARNRPKLAATHLPPAGLPKAHAEVLCAAGASGTNIR